MRKRTLLPNQKAGTLLTQKKSRRSQKPLCNEFGGATPATRALPVHRYSWPQWPILCHNGPNNSLWHSCGWLASGNNGTVPATMGLWLNHRQKGSKGGEWREN